MAPDDSCIFCKIAAGELPSTRVHEDERTIAFMDINPTVPGHTLVIPRAHSTDLTDIKREDLAAIMGTAQWVVQRLLSNLGAEGVNILQNTGPAAGQVVFHTHIHVIPRHSDDGIRSPLSPRPGDPEEIARVAATIRGD